jgi:YD repeat-containing protein
LLSEGGLWPNDTVSLTYANGLRTSLGIAMPAGSVWTQEYGCDSARRLTSVTSPAGAFDYTYDPVKLQRVKRLNLPNGAVITNGYDSVARLTATVMNNSGGTALDSYAYTYNQANERTQVTRTAGDYANYLYDNEGELTSAVGHEISGSIRAFDDFIYTYDGAGNLLTRLRPAVGSNKILFLTSPIF